jgi:Domain of unknown function (DUF4340)
VAPAQAVNSRVLVNLALLAAVTGLAAFALFGPKQGENKSGPLSDLKPENAASIQVERSGQPALALERHGAEWRLSAPLAARVDSVKVQRLLQFLAAPPSRRLPAEDLARFDLARPQARVSVDGHDWAFGMLNPLTQEQYIQDGDWVYLVDGRLTAEVLAPASRFLSRHLLGDGESPVAFEIGALKLEQQAGRWVVSPPPAEAPSQDDLNRWVNEWRLAAAGEVQATGVSSGSGDKIRLRLADGRDLSFEVQAREPDLVLVRADEGLAYRFPKAVGERLLQPGK